MPALDKQFVLPKDGSTHDVKKDGKDLPLEALIKQNENGDGANVKIEVDGSSKDGDSISYTRIDASVPSSSFVNGERIVSKTMDLSKDYQTSTGKTAKFDGPAVVTYTVCPKPETTKEDCTTLETTVNIKQPTTPTNLPPVFVDAEVSSYTVNSQFVGQSDWSDPEGDTLTYKILSHNVPVTNVQGSNGVFGSNNVITSEKKDAYVELEVSDGQGNTVVKKVNFDVEVYKNFVSFKDGSTEYTIRVPERVADKVGAHLGGYLPGKKSLVNLIVLTP